MNNVHQEKKLSPCLSEKIGQFILDMPILLKLFIAMSVVGVLPFLALSAAEILRIGGRPPSEINLPALFISLGLILSFLAVGFLSRLIIRPIKELQQVVKTIMAGQKGSLALGRKDEIGRLAQAFEQLLNERRKAETALREKAYHVRLLLNSTGEGIYAVDLNGCCTLANPSALRMLGYDDAGDLLGRSMHDLIHHTRADGSPYPSDECQIYQAFKSNVPLMVSDEVFWRKDGSSFPVEYSFHPIEKDGEICGAVCNFHDLTERKQLEEEKQKLMAQLFQSQKMEAVGLLAGGVAHDFNNILTVMQGYGELLLNKTQEGDSSHKYIKGILDAGMRAAALTQQLLVFSRNQTLTPKVFDLNGHLHNYRQFLSRLVREDIEIRLLCKDEKIPVIADSGQIELVLMNLVTNARDAMPGGGRLTIGTELVLLDEEFVKVFGFGKPGIFGLISVEDSGIGMDEKTREKVFEPFYTTKEVGKGTGLGLSMADGIVAQHGGFIKVYSEPGNGTVFKIYLPIAEQQAGCENSMELYTDPVKGGSESIIIAEDEATIRQLFRDVLMSYGYNVIEAEDGGAAVRMLKLNKDEVQLVILDAIMPKLNGKEAYEQMKVLCPDIKTILVSGYSADIFGSTGAIDSEPHFISKPVSPANLAKYVRAVLDNTL